MSATATRRKKKALDTKAFDWEKIAQTVFLSRAMDDIEEQKLVPEKKVLYQFSARGHDVPQVILGRLINHPKDAVSAYYRSRPIMLTLGLDTEDALASPMARSGGYSDGRDIGVVCNLPGKNSPTVLPMAGDVGSQYTPACGWAQSLMYRKNTLGESDYEGAISVILGGDGSVATNGFWSALIMATTLKLPVLFYIEDNGYGISVPRRFQTPGDHIVQNLESFQNLKLFNGNGSDPAEASKLLKQAVDETRKWEGPVLIRLTVPRLSGHSGQDNQSYKGEGLIKKEQDNDPLVNLEKAVVPDIISKQKWKSLGEEAKKTVQQAAESAWARPEPDTHTAEKYRFAEEGEMQDIGGLAAGGHEFPEVSEEPEPEKQRITLVEALRRTLDYELETNSKLLVFGEDVGPKGGVHAVTLGLQKKYGEDRVFDTSLSEEGIIGRAVGMAYAGLMPVAEIQFRKYADPATEQLNNCGTTRWRTNNRFASPMVVRMPGGFFKCGDPWHSVSNEVFFAHAVGWQIVMPSNAQDAVGLLRASMRSNNPTVFFEHRNLLDAKWARSPYPGDKFIVPIGKGKKLMEGNRATIVTWGAMTERCFEAAENLGGDIDIIDLRSIRPWDREMVLESVAKTNRCLVVHEDTMTAGFGAEIVSVIMKEAFSDLDAPVGRMAVPDIPIPHNVPLMESILPSVEKISRALDELIAF